MRLEHVVVLTVSVVACAMAAVTVVALGMILFTALKMNAGSLRVNMSWRPFTIRVEMAQPGVSEKPRDDPERDSGGLRVATSRSMTCGAERGSENGYSKRPQVSPDSRAYIQNMQENAKMIMIVNALRNARLMNFAVPLIASLRCFPVSHIIRVQPLQGELFTYAYPESGK